VRGVFKPMTYWLPASGPTQVLVGGWLLARVAGPVQLLSVVRPRMRSADRSKPWTYLQRWEQSHPCSFSGYHGPRGYRPGGITRSSPSETRDESYRY